MTTHPREETLSARVDGELSAAALARVDAHLDACGPCRAAVAELRAVKAAVSQIPKTQMPADLAASLRGRWTVGPAPAGARLRPWWWGTAAAGLAAAAALVFFWAAPERPGPAIPADILLAAHSRYQAENLVPAGDRSPEDFSFQLASYREE